MGKFSNLASIKTANRESFAYTPPDAAFGALRTLIILDCAQVEVAVLASVLRGIRRVNPLGRIVMIDRVASESAFEEAGIVALLDKEMRIAPVEALLMQHYRNHSPEPKHYITMTAPGYVGEYECVISLGNQNGALHNLVRVVTEARAITDEGSTRVILTQINDSSVLCDVFFTLGQFVHGVVVDTGAAGGKIIWGDNLLTVDETAFRLTGQSKPDFLNEIRRLEKHIVDGL
jgi:hypothetical protein